ncbi:hypothetical protein AURDEDRAFT_167937 [Auricularia subglabra TFB-10046 SS5]|nr:hypothetical protein AURDEDRAFT_167937 [Auricularia subglabra TFB-10046 SS5]
MPATANAPTHPGPRTRTGQHIIAALDAALPSRSQPARGAKKEKVTIKISSSQLTDVTQWRQRVNIAKAEREVRGWARDLDAARLPRRRNEPRQAKTKVTSYAPKKRGAA